MAAVKLFFAVGVSVGLVVGGLLCMGEIIHGRLVDGMLIFIFSPIAHGVLLVIYFVLGMPIYKLLARNGWLGLGKIRVVEDV